MLVVARFRHQEIVCRIPGRPEPLVVRIADIRGHKVLVGITCDRDIEINRREVDELIQAGLDKAEAIEAGKVKA